jgi:dihydrofolate reductase
MRKIVSFMHTSLDGFVAGPNGEMDWIKVDAEMFDYAGRQTAQSDTALYGRKTYEIMDAYWPEAGNQPNASKHDIEHSAWYNEVDKIVISKTMQDQKKPRTRFIGSDVAQEIQKLKQIDGNDIVIFGSPSVMHFLLRDHMIDDLWLFVNPILLGKGIPLFKNISDQQKLTLKESQTFASGVVGLHYEKA